MLFVEIPTFTRRVLDLLDDDEYRELQLHFTQHPGVGRVIPGSGGLRVIYYWWIARDRISMLFIYRKNEQDDLTPNQVKLLRRVLEL